MSVHVIPRHCNIQVDGAERNDLRSMNQERKDKGHGSCEVLLVTTRGSRHYAHKDVLISRSEYFRKYFEENPGSPASRGSESDRELRSDDEISFSKGSGENARNSRFQATILLPGISPELLTIVLEYMYTSQLALRAENVNEILLVGCYFQMTSLMKACGEELLRKPAWRSPLVSPKLWNFMKSLDNAERENQPNSSTAITWATDGGRPTTYETRASRGKTTRLGAAFYGEKTLADSETHRRLPVRSYSRKRAYLRGPSPDERSWDQNEKRPYIFRNNQTTIGELHREIPLNFESHRNLARSAEVLNLQGSPGQRDSPKAANKCHHGIPALVDIRKPGLPSKLPGHNEFHNFGPQSGRELLDASPKDTHRRYSGENCPVTMFPQISECNRSLAAYASAFGMPKLPSGYFGFPFVNPLGGVIHPQNFPGLPFIGNAGHKVGDIGFPPSPYFQQGLNTHKESEPTTNRYTCSVTAIYASPNFIQEYQAPHGGVKHGEAQNCRFVGASGERSPHAVGLRAANFPGEEVAGGSQQATLDLSYRPALKRFCPDIVQKHDFESEGDPFTDVREETDGSVDDDRKLSKREGILDDSRSTKSNQRCIESESGLKQKPELDHASSTAILTPAVNSKNGDGGKQPALIGYNIKKRRLLTAAQDLTKKDREKDTCKTTTCRPTNLNIEESPNLPRNSQCSREDTITTHECNRMDVSDPESDDSGRPSSVWFRQGEYFANG